MTLTITSAAQFKAVWEALAAAVENNTADFEELADEGDAEAIAVMEKTALIEEIETQMGAAMASLAA